MATMPATWIADQAMLPSRCSGSARCQVSKRTGLKRVNQATTGTSARQTLALVHSHTAGSHAEKLRPARWMSRQGTAELAIVVRAHVATQPPTSKVHRQGRKRSRALGEF